MFIGSGLIGFELNQISLDKRFGFFGLMVRFENFQNRNNRTDRTFIYYEFGPDRPGLFLNTPIYFLINCFKYFGFFLIFQFIS